jgi:hypothetical protein
METFIVRVWVPPDPVGREQQLCGVVEHLGSGGNETTFVDEGELLALLRAPIRKPIPIRQVGGAP